MWISWLLWTRRSPLYSLSFTSSYATRFIVINDINCLYKIQIRIFRCLLLYHLEYYNLIRWITNSFWCWLFCTWLESWLFFMGIEITNNPRSTVFSWHNFGIMQHQIEWGQSHRLCPNFHPRSGLSFCLLIHTKRLKWEKVMFQLTLFYWPKDLNCSALKNPHPNLLKRRRLTTRISTLYRRIMKRSSIKLNCLSA